MPTAKELLNEVGADNPEAGMILASRVEKVLALKQPDSDTLTFRELSGWDACMTAVLRILNGEE